MNNTKTITDVIVAIHYDNDFVTPIIGSIPNDKIGFNPLIFMGKLCRLIESYFNTDCPIDKNALFECIKSKMIEEVDGTSINVDVTIDGISETKEIFLYKSTLA